MSIRFKNRGEEFRHQKLKHGTTTWKKARFKKEFDANFRLLYALSRAYDLFLLNKAKRIQFCVNYGLLLYVNLPNGMIEAKKLMQ